MTTPAGWYDDGSGDLRWWDGQQWTTHVRTAEHTPPAAPALPAAPAPTAADATKAAAATEAAVPDIPAAPEQPFAPPYALPGQEHPLPGSGTTDPYGATTHSNATSSHGPNTPYGTTAPYGIPPYGTTTAYGAAPAAPPRRRVSPAGIAGLAAAVIGVVLACIPPVALAGWVLLGIALVVSVVSLFLRGAKWPGIAGLSVAIVGSALAGAVALVTLGLTAAVEAGGGSTPAPSPSASAAPTSATDPSDIEGAEMVAFEDLAVGDCLPYVDYTDVDQIYELPVVPCDQPHTDEVFYIFEVEDGEFPGDSALQETAWDGCLAQFESFVGLTYEQSELDFYSYQPTKGSWNRADDRAIQCIVYSYEDVTGSLQGAAR